jgi:hypothetical protein
VLHLRRRAAGLFTRGDDAVDQTLGALRVFQTLRVLATAAALVRWVLSQALPKLLAAVLQTWRHARQENETNTPFSRRSNGTWAQL